MNAAKSLQLCPALCDPIDSSPPGSLVPGILQARILEWVAISFSNAWRWKEKVKSLSHVRLLATPWVAAYQAPIFQATVLEWGAIAFSKVNKGYFRYFIKKILGILKEDNIASVWKTPPPPPTKIKMRAKVMIFFCSYDVPGTSSLSLRNCAQE